MSAPHAPSQPVLSVRDLTVVRGGRVLFEALGFDVAAGGALLLKGPNGAGKTSLLLALAGVIRADRGTIAYTERGAAAELEPASHLLLPQNALKPRLSVGENLRFWRSLNGPTGLSVGAALERVGLGGLDAIEAGHLSTGQSRRLALARLLLSRRAVWLLDEPTAALDAAGDALVGAMLGAHCAAGGLAVVATHHAIALSGGAAVQTVAIAAGAARLAEPA